MKKMVVVENKKIEDSIKSTLKLIGIFALFLFSSILQIPIIKLLNYDIDNLTTNQNLIVTACSDIILLIILVSIYYKSLKKDFKNLKGNLYKYLEEGVKYWIIGLIVMMVSNVLISLLTTAEATNEESVQEFIHASKYFSIITVGIIGPIIEELVFRKAFREAIKNDMSFILISGLIFGGLHVILSFNSAWDLLYIIPYSSLGIAFGYTYCKTNNIYVSTFIHIFHNTVLTILSIIGAGFIIW